ncbi:MAG: hypothetical protein Q9214_007514 [Letrouitia sp. 1 TL-2023]
MASQSQPSHALQVSSPSTRALLAGGVAGTVVDMSLYPIDTLKTRLQAAAGFSASGGFRGIYAGVGSALVGSAPGAALFFVTYEGVKMGFARRREGNGRPSVENSGWSEPLEHMLAASAGEIAACAMRVPTEVVKQRAQAAQQPSSMAALRHILSQRGSIGLGGVWGELYRGWGITVIREVPFTVIQFPLWEAMKGWRSKGTRRHGVSAAESGLFGSLAGAVAAAATTPLDVLKTRMMLAKEKQAAVPLFMAILRESGPNAFFAGLVPRILWISAGGAIFLGSYQLAYNTMTGIT